MSSSSFDHPESHPRFKLCKLCGFQIKEKTWKTHLESRIHTDRQFQLQKHVLVSGYPLDTRVEILIEYFLKFGKIEGVQLDKRQNKSMIVKYESVRMANMVKRRWRHAIGRYELNVVSRHPLLLQTVLHSNELSWNEFFINFLLKKDTVSDQIYEIVKELSLMPEDIQRRHTFCEKLEEKFQEFFPSCKLIPFGPTVNGLGVKGCDLDLFLNVNVEFGTDKIAVDIEKLLDNLDLVRRAPDKSGFETLIQNLEIVQVIEVIGAIIRRYVPGCEDICAQASARCPSVRFYSKIYSIFCEISINSTLALHNTVLISHYQKVDERFRLLYFVIHYWARHYHLGNSRKGRLSKYAITLLVIFFLQNTMPNILPTVEELQDPTEEQILVNGWECQICVDLDKVKKDESDEQSIETLVAEFFSFYSNLDYETWMISVRSGQLMCKVRFVEEMKESADAARFSKFKIRLLTLQDPFELNRNVTANVTEEVYNDWMRLLKEAEYLSFQPNFLEKTLDIWGIPLLLSDAVRESLPQTDAEGEPLLIVDAEGEPLSQADVEKELLSIADTIEEPLSQEDAEEEPLSQEDAEGEPLSILDAEGEPLSILDAEEESLSILDAEGQPLSQAGAVEEPLSFGDAEEEPLSIADAEEESLSQGDPVGEPSSLEDGMRESFSADDEKLLDLTIPLTPELCKCREYFENLEESNGGIGDSKDTDEGSSPQHTQGCLNNACKIISDTFTRGFRFTEINTSERETGTATTSRPIDRGKNCISDVEVVDLDDEPPAKRFIREDPTNGIAVVASGKAPDVGTLKEFEFQASFATWQNRDEAQNIVGTPSGDPIEAEAAVSEVIIDMIETDESADGSPVGEWRCTLSYYKNSDESGIAVTLQALQEVDKELISTFNDTMKDNLPRIVSKTLLYQMSRI